ncbi:MAG: autotransporter-associated beta strand repeat-containing protein, partial [Pirellulales bacterium]
MPYGSLTVLNPASPIVGTSFSSSFGAGTLEERWFNAVSGSRISATTPGDAIVTNAPAGLYANGNITIANNIAATVGASTVTIGSTAGTSTFSGTINAPRDIVLNNAPGTQATYSGVISGAGVISKTNSGTAVVNNASNTFGTAGAKQIVVSGGTLAVNSDGALGNASNTLALTSNTTDTTANATLRLDASVTLNAARSLTLNTTGGTVSALTGVTAEIAGVIQDGTAGTRNLLINGNPANAGTVVLSNSNTFTGQTTVNAGVLAISNGSALGSSAGGTSIIAGASLELRTVNVVSEPLVIRGQGAGNLGALRSTTGSSTYGGPITTTGVTSTWIQNNTTGTTLTLSGSLAADYGVTFAGIGDTTVSGAITGSATPYVAGILEGLINQANLQTSVNPGATVAPGITRGQTNAISAAAWGDNQTWVYTGEIYDADGIFSLAENIDDQATVFINGIQRLNNGTWNQPTTTGSNVNNGFGGTVNFGASPKGDGWYPVEIRLQNGGGGAGPVAGTGWTSSFGFGYSATGSTSTDGSNYVAPGTASDTVGLGFVNGVSGATARFRTATPSSVTKNGGGTLTLSGPNTYAGTTTINQGTVIATTSAALGSSSSAASGTVIASGATLQLQGAGSVTINDAITAGSSVINAPISGSAMAPANIVSVGANTLASTVTGGNGFLSGVINLQSNSGTLTTSNISLGANQLLVSGVGDVQVNGVVSSQTGTVASASGGLTGNYYNFTFALQNPADSALLNSAGSNSQINLDTYAPTVTVLTPRVDFGAGTESVPGDGLTLDRGGSGGLVFGGIAPSINADNVAGQWNGYIFIANTGTYTFTTRSDDGSRLWIDINQDGDFADSGEMAVDNNFFQGMTNRSNATPIALTGGQYYPIRVAGYEAGGGAGFQASWQQNSGTGAFARTIIDPSVLFTSVTTANPVSLLKTGAGKLTLSNANTYGGRTDVTGGTLSVLTDGALGSTSAGTVVSNVGTLQLNGVNYATAEALTISGTGTANSGALQTAAGTSSSFAGPITVGTPASILSPTAGQTLTLNGNIVAPDTLTFAGAGDTIVNGVISGTEYSSGLREGVINGNAFDTTTANPGSLIVNQPIMGQISTTSNPFVAQANHVWSDNQTWVYTGQVFTADGQLAFAENIDDSVLIKIDGVTKLLDGTWNSPTSTGNLNLTPGWHDIEIRLGQGGGGAGPNVAGSGWTSSFGFGIDTVAPFDSAGAGANAANYVVPVDNGTMNLFRVKTGNYSIVKADSGTLFLTNNNTYTVPTTVSGGVVQLTGATSQFSSVSVQSGAQLVGTGTVGGPLSVASGATLRPGAPATSVGTFNVGNVTLPPSATFATGAAIELNITNASTYDKVVVTGGVVLSGDTTLTLPGSFVPASGNSFTLVDTTTGVTGPGKLVFAGVPLSEGDTFFYNGSPMKITYVGGADSKDIVISYNTAPVINADSYGTGIHNIIETKVVGANLQVKVDGILRLDTPFASLTGLIINGQTGSDNLIIDYTNGSPIPAGGITYAGGTGGELIPGDILTLVNGSVTTVTYGFLNNNDGSVNVDGRIVNYTGLEPVFDNLSAVNRIFNFNGGAETITWTVVAGLNQIDSTLGESVSFGNPSASLSIDMGSGDDTLNINNVLAGFAAAVTIIGNAGTDATNLNTGLSLGSATSTGDLSITTESIITSAAGTIVTQTGTGNVQLSANSISLGATIDTSAATSGTVSIAVATSLSMTAAADVNAKGSFTQTGAGTVSTAADVTTSNSAISFASPITLTGDVVLSSGTGNLTLSSTVNGGSNLTANSSGLTTLGGAIGGTTPLTSVTTNAGGTTAINGGSVITTGAQTYNDAVTLGTGATLTSNSSGNITFVTTVNGGQTLAINTAGTTTFGGSVGGTTPLTSVTTNAGGSTAINGGSVTTTGAQTYNDAVTL